MHLLYPDLPLKEREERLALEAKKKEMRNYKRTMQQSEIDAEKGRFANDASEKKKLEKTLVNLQKEYKERINAITARMDERLEKIETGKTEISGYLYGLPDFANKRMMWRDKFGELVDSRDLLPDEMTGNLFVDGSTNKALEDLPFETQQAIQEMTNAGGWEKHNPDGWASASDEELLSWYGTTNYDVISKMIWNNAEGKYVIPVNAFDPVEHNEDGWETASDAELMAQYGTVDISVIRTLVFDDASQKYILGEAGEQKAKGKGKGKK